MNKSASLSVVIPCYNAERYLASTVDSVLLQNGPDLEVVIVDDGSRDGSADLIRQRYGSTSNVRLLQQANQGVAAARNHGVREARGEWIAFVDADDIWLPGKLRAQMDLLSMEPEARMAYTAWQVWSSAAPLPTPDFLAELQAQADDTERWSGATGWIYPQLLLECAVWTSTVLAHRSVFDEVGLFDSTLRIGEDWDLWLRASRVTPIVRVPRPLALYRMHPNNITKGPLETNYKDVVISRALARWGYVSPDGTAARKTEVDRGLARSWSDFAGANLMAGDLAGARHGATMALRTDPRSLLGWKLLGKSIAHSLLHRKRVAR